MNMHAANSEVETPSAIVAGELPETDGPAKYLLFALAGENYALPIGNLLEVDQPPVVTPLPRGPHWLAGVTNLRGEIISVIDCRAWFGLARQVHDQRRLCVVATRERDLTSGLLVDQVAGMIYLAAAQLHAPSDSFTPFLSALAEHEGRTLKVLDAESLLRSLDTDY